MDHRADLWSLVVVVGILAVVTVTSLLATRDREQVEEPTKV